MTRGLRWCRRAHEWRAARGVLLGCCIALGVACRESNEAPDSAAPSSSPPSPHGSFRFDRPASFRPLELNAHGEFLLAPPQATVQGAAPRFAVRAGADFALDVNLAADQVALPDSPHADRVAVHHSDLIVWGRPGEYRFVALVNVVPEWDESDRRRYACSSAGALNDGAQESSFSQAAIEAMVAACRSLSLPRLE